MAIYGKSGGTVKKLEPRVKHNGVIKTPTTGWVKQNGVLKKIWQAFVPVESISISGPANIYYSDRYGGTETYTVTVSPPNATNKTLEYVVEDLDGPNNDTWDKIVETGDGYVKIKFTGRNDYADGLSWDYYRLIAKATDGSGVEGHLDITINI